MIGLKTLWKVIILIVLFGILIVAYSYYSRPVESEVNVCLHLSDYGCSTVSHLIELGVGWVRTDWETTNASSMRDYSQILEDTNIGLLTIIDINTFNQTTPTLEEWKKNLTEIVNSEGFNNTDAVEIWNEPNAGAYIPPETYYEMLRTGYEIIKNYTGLPVVFAGVSPNIDGWKDYLNTVFAFGDAESYFDIMGIHLYDDMQINLETLQFVEGLTSKPVWLTETGKPSMDSDEGGQAEYLSLVCSTFKPLVSKIFIYELYDNQNLSNSTEGHFGLLTVDGTLKEAYWVVCDINRE